MKMFCFLITVLLVAGLYSPLAAKYYRYVDKDGVVTYTDDLTQIPEAGRRSAETFKEEQPAQEQIIQETGVADEASKEELSTYQELRKLKAELDNEYGMLESDKKELLEEKNRLITKGDIEAYNSRIDILNRQIKAFEAKRERFQSKLDAYKKTVKEKQ